MRAWSRRPLPLAAAAIGVLAAACGTNNATSGSTGSPSGTDGTGPTGPSVQFDIMGPLVAPSTQAVPLGLGIQGGDDTALTLWLEGAYLDASLDRGSVDTKEHHAQVLLQTPSEPSTFTVRARTAGGSEARLEVTVGLQGVASVTLQPTYAGKRPEDAVYGSIFPRTSCEELAKATLDDGTSKTAAKLGQPLTIVSVPAGTRVSISLRMAHYARGCVDVDRLAPGASKDFATVELFDRPLSLAKASLQTTYTFEPSSTEGAAYVALLDAGVARAANAFIAVGTAEGVALLDAMKTAAPSEWQATFTGNRNAGTGWDPKVVAWLGQHPPALRARAVSWLTLAKAEAQAPLMAKLVAAKTVDRVTVTPSTWGAVDLTTRPSVTVKGPFEWTADTDDGVQTSGTFYVSPTALLARAADGYAVKEVPSASDVPSALAAQVDCSALASSLVGAGESYPTCGAACTASLCRTALLAMWNTAAGASAAATDVIQIAMNFSAHAQIDEKAEPTFLDGTWVGKITSGTGASGMQGKVAAKR